ncbi:hypothetical protein Tco_0671008 [Tanacetum coccineum]
MADSSKGKDSTKLVVNDEIIKYVWAKYGNKWQVGDAMVDVILDDFSDEDSTTNEDSSSDDHNTIFNGKTWSSSKYSKAKTRSSFKHLTASARSKKTDVGASAGSKTLLVPSKSPPPIRNCILGLAKVSTYTKILNKEFGIGKPKDDVATIKDVASKRKRKMV